MSKHRKQAQFERARWNLLILAPLWILQLALTLGMTGLFAWRLSDTIKNYDDRKNAGKIPAIQFAWGATNVGMSFIAAVCTWVEILKYMAETLTPWTMLFTHVIKMTCALAILALDVVIYIQHSEEHYSLIGLGMDGAFMITAVALTIYAVIRYRRLSIYDDYARPVNVKGYGFNDGMDRDRDFSYSSRLSIRNSMDQRRSFSNNARLSIGSMNGRPVDLENMGRTPSYYSHERDTQFDDYVARRNSRDSPPGALSPDPAVVTTGQVQSRSRGSTITRATSYTSDHVLVAVPEDEAELPHETGRHESDSTALLGNNKRNSDNDIMFVPPVAQEVDVEPKWRRE